MALTLGLLALVLYLLACREPRYGGKSLSRWLEDFDRGPTETQVQAADALRHIGADAVPFLVARLRQQDSNLKLTLVDLARRQSLVKVQFVPARTWQYRALVACDALGPAARSALPALEELLYSKQAAPNLAYVVARIGPDAIPVLTRASTNAARPIQIGAKVCLVLLQSRSDILFPPAGTPPADAEFRKRVIKYHLKVLRAASTRYRAEHPEQMLPESWEVPPPSRLPADFAPSDLPASHTTNRSQR